MPEDIELADFTVDNKAKFSRLNEDKRKKDNRYTNFLLAFFGTLGCVLLFLFFRDGYMRSGSVKRTDCVITDIDVEKEVYKSGNEKWFLYIDYEFSLDKNYTGMATMFGSKQRMENIKDYYKKIKCEVNYDSKNPDRNSLDYLNDYKEDYRVGMISVVVFYVVVGIFLWAFSTV